MLRFLLHIVSLGFLLSEVTLAASSLRGTVEQFTLGPRGEPDGLLIRANGQDGITVRFPPHMGALLVQDVKVGDTVRVTSNMDIPAGVLGVRALSISDERTGKTIEDTPPRTITVSGNIRYLLTNDRQEKDGALLSSGVQVKFPPHVGRELVTLAARSPRGKLDVEGRGKSTPWGEVVEAMRMSYNGQRLQTLEGPPAPPPLAE